MPQLQNLVLTDRASTPVAHTFVPRDIANGVGTVIETTGIPIGEPRVSISLNRTSERCNGLLKFSFPVVQTQTINGVSTPVVVRTTIVDMKFSFANTSTEQERKDAVGMAYSALAPAATLINDTLVKLQGVY